MNEEILPGPPDDSLAVHTFRSCDERGCGTSTFAQPFGPRALFGQGSGGEYAEAVSSRYAVAWRRRDHTLRILITQRIAGPTLSAAERARSERTMRTVADRHGVRVGQLAFALPDRKAPLLALGFDLDGRLWVERAVEDGAPRRADIYGLDGSHLAMVQWPADVRLTSWAIRGRTGLGVRLTPSGEMSVVRLRFR